MQNEMAMAEIEDCVDEIKSPIISTFVRKFRRATTQLSDALDSFDSGDLHQFRVAEKFADFNRASNALSRALSIADWLPKRVAVRYLTAEDRSCIEGAKQSAEFLIGNHRTYKKWLSTLKADWPSLV